MIRKDSCTPYSGLNGGFRGAADAPRTDGGFLPAPGPFREFLRDPMNKRRSYVEAAPVAANDS